MFRLSNIYTWLLANIRLNTALIVIFLLNFANISGQSEPKTKINRVVIDAGHGGIDPGASGSKHHEKDIVLAIALKLGNYIKENLPDVKVIYTRETDIYIPLMERAEIANKNQADVFISIHCNSNPNKKPFGTETYTMGLAKAAENLEVAKRENSVILIEENFNTKYQGFDNSPESYIMLSLMQNTYRDQSIRLASYIQNQFKERANRMDRGVKQAGFLVLWQTAMPSVLVEAGFLSNQEEEKFLASSNGQDYIASSIFRAFRDYKNLIEHKSIFLARNDELPAEKQDSSEANQKVTTIKSPAPSIEIEDSTKAKAISYYYMVQISSSTKPIHLNSPLFKGVKNITEYKVADRYKYTVGQKTSYKEILVYLSDIKKLFPDAFPVGCIDGKFVTAKEVMNQIKALN